MSDPNILPSKIEGLISEDLTSEAKTLLHMAKEAQETGEMPDLSRLADPFAEFWARHPIHEKGLPPEIVASFREFAAGIWNGARFELGLKQLAAIDKLCSLGLNPEMHLTLEASVEGVMRMVANLRKDLANSVPV